MRLSPSLIAGMWLPCLAIYLGTATAQPTSTSTSIVRDTTTNTTEPMDELDQLFKDLEVEGTEADALKASFGNDASIAGLQNLPQKLLSLTCELSKLAIGKTFVDTAPLNMTIVEEHWSQACIETPYCIIQPTSAKQVSLALQILKFFQIKFAVRSGGHSPSPGWSSVNEGGVLLDLQKLNSISLSKDKKTATLGAGGRWTDVIAKLDQDGVTVVAGRVGIVGIGGFLLGGGLHHVLGEHGTAADNVKNFEVVLSSGKIVNANAKENTDLFWALKGGGANFGVLTSVELYTIPAATWYEFRVYAVDDLPKIVDRYVQWQGKSNSDVKGTASLITTVDTITLFLQYNAAVERPEIFSVFYDMEPMAYAVPSTIGTFKSLAAILASVTSDEPMRHDYRAVSSGIDGQLYLDVYNFWREKALAVSQATGANQTFTIQPVSGNVAKASASRGGNAMNIPSYNHIWWTSLIDWRDEKDDALVRSVSIATSEKWKSLGAKKGKAVDYVFMNDASRDQNPLASYGKDNLNKLKTIAKKYDPDQVFQRQQNGGFLLSKA